jgi:hypothetical protein
LEAPVVPDAVVVEPGENVLRFSEDLHVFEAQLPTGPVARERLPAVLASAMACARAADGRRPANAYDVRLLSSQRLCIAAPGPFAVHLCADILRVTHVREGRTPREYHVTFTCSHPLSLARGAVMRIFGPRQHARMAQVLYVGATAVVVRLAYPGAMTTEDCTSMQPLATSASLAFQLGLGPHDLRADDPVPVAGTSTPFADEVHVHTRTPHGCQASDRVLLQECGFTDHLATTVRRVVSDHQLVVQGLPLAPAQAPKRKVGDGVDFPTLPDDASLVATNVVGVHPLPRTSSVRYLSLAMGMRAAGGVLLGGRDAAVFGVARGTSDVIGFAVFQPPLDRVPFVDVTFLDPSGRVSPMDDFCILLRLGR